MSRLLIRASLVEAPQRCEWALVEAGGEIARGKGPLADLPRDAGKVQLVVPAEQVVIVRARLPKEARRRAGSVLVYAVEEQTLGEPDANRVVWLGSDGDDDVLAVIDKNGLLRWREALQEIGVREYEIHCETLLVPYASHEWTFAWNGESGFVRSGPLEGAATDTGTREEPPLALMLLLEEASARGQRPHAMTIYALHPDAILDMNAWQKALSIPLRFGGLWDWRAAKSPADVSLARERRRWSVFARLAMRVRPAAVIAGIALTFHAAALLFDWGWLASEQRALRKGMETQFRSVAPEVTAIVDPAMQMRRKLAEARHVAGFPDEGDFLPMIEKVAEGSRDSPTGNLRALAFESGRMTLEYANADPDLAQRIMTGLRQTGLVVDTQNANEHQPIPGEGGARPLVLVVRAP